MIDSPAEWIRSAAPWLLDPKLGVCVVGSQALREACRRAGAAGPDSADLDLAWGLDVDAGEELLSHQRVGMPATQANRHRGTLAMKLDGHRIEITSFRRASDDEETIDPDGPLEPRILADLAGRDMTVGALAHWLAEDRILDPYGGLDHWRDRRVVPVGDPVTRIAEHPIRWLRYYRRTHQWEFTLDPAIREARVDVGVLATEPVEAIGAEFRAALLQCRSPGEFFRDLYHCGALEAIAPELALQFDGRPAGPIQHHPEGSQANHLVLSLEWIVAHTQGRKTRERLATAVAVLCHDLGKGLTPPDRFPAHHGHEGTGLVPLRDLLTRYPVLTDPAGRRLAEAVCSLHLKIRMLDGLRPGTQAKLYGRYLRDANFPIDLFALAVGADSGGRLGMEAEGEVVAEQVRTGMERMRERCGEVDAGKIYQRYGKEDKERFRTELHQAWARALGESRS